MTFLYFDLGKGCRQIFDEIKPELREKYDQWFIAVQLIPDAILGLVK